VSRTAVGNGRSPVGHPFIKRIKMKKMLKHFLRQGRRELRSGSTIGQGISRGTTPENDGDENVFGYLFLCAALAVLFAMTFVLAVYGYMDHTNNVVSLKMGQHDSRCIHQVCDLSEAAR
jgi:hypothetical protein